MLEVPNNPALCLTINGRRPCWVPLGTHSLHDFVLDSRAYGTVMQSFTPQCRLLVLTERVHGAAGAVITSRSSLSPPPRSLPHHSPSLRLILRDNDHWWSRFLILLLGCLLH
ncbi:hypothetical protein MSAN_02467100 [Mycena sanguinolenta]|uniref:Uncharacterized protein n=1 Tax=Mycena sanguinolenta TaxID=230812 RepID=A0A8H6WWU7_9AGAR|nr:hypothetical protein MSAN_02467100 [Mycena sanguinolenta]